MTCPFMSFLVLVLFSIPCAAGHGFRDIKGHKRTKKDKKGQVKLKRLYISTLYITNVFIIQNSLYIII